MKIIKAYLSYLKNPIPLALIMGCIVIIALSFGVICGEQLDEGGKLVSENVVGEGNNSDSPNATGDTQPESDIDNDGIPDSSDSDMDGDGVENDEDTDQDGDGVLNDQDNCKETPNADQVDSNNNGVGDACEEQNNQATGTQGAGLWKNKENNLPRYWPGRIIVKLKDLQSKGLLLEALKKFYTDFSISTLSINHTTAFAQGIGSQQILLLDSKTLSERAYDFLSQPTQHNAIDSDSAAVITYLRGLTFVVYAHLDRLYNLETTDPYYGVQWSLNNTGQAYPITSDKLGETATGTAGMDVRAEGGWKNDRSSSENQKVIAVIDTGLDYYHEDIKENSVTGYDFSSSCYYDRQSQEMVIATDDNPYDEEGHGTHVAGIIAAVADNTIGISGVSHKNKIMPLKVFDCSYDTVIAQAIDYAVANGASVMNMSLGREGDETTGVLFDAIKSAAQEKVISVVSAGNDSANAAYYVPAKVPEAITVGAMASNGQKSSYSNFGMKLDVTSPGDYILSLKAAEYRGLGIYHENYLILSGTSMAAPLVTGIVSVIQANHPDFSPEQVRQTLRYSVTEVPLGNNAAGVDEDTGYGLVNMGKVLSIKSIPEAFIYHLSYDTTALSAGSTLPISVRVKGKNITDWAIQYRSIDAGESTWQKLIIIEGEWDSEQPVAAWPKVPAGTYYLQLIVNDKTGTSAKDTRKVTFSNNSSKIQTQNVVINEIMYNPTKVSDSVGEYIELLNIGPGDINIKGWTIKDKEGSNPAIIGENEESVILKPHDYYLLGKYYDSTQNGGLTGIDSFFIFSLGNSGDEISLIDTQNVIREQVNYVGGDPWSTCAGASLERIGINTTDSNGDGILDGSSDPANWKCATQSYGAGDLGTPKTANSK